MRSVRALGFVTVILAAGGNAALGAEDERPWAFNSPRADGYSIDLDAAAPVPGTELMPGSVVEFTVNVHYTMGVAQNGSITLVFEDESDLNVESSGEQMEVQVKAPSGTASLTRKLTIPCAKELRLYIPLVPDGMTKTSGEITLRYPIHECSVV